MMLCRYFLCFAIYSFIGWAYESLYYTLQQRKFVNSGFLSTCFCPIYGVGAMVVWLFFKNINNTFVLFLAGMITTSAIEYFVSWFLETVFGKRWWDYTGWPLNIKGRVCIIAAMAFGTLSVLQVKLIAPISIGLVMGLKPIALYILTVIVASVMIIDTVISIKDIDNEDLWYVEKQSEIFGKDSIVKRIINNLKR